MDMIRLNNIVLLIIATAIPFFKTFTESKLKYLDFQFFYLILIAYFLVYSFATSKKIVFEKAGKLSLSLICLFVVQCLSTLFAYDIDLGFQKLYNEFQFLIIFIVLNKMIINNESYEFIFRGLLYGFLLSCMIAIFQFLGVKQFYIFSDQELNGNAGTIEESIGKFTRIWGPFGNSLTFSEYLSTAGIILYTYYRTVKKQRLLATVLIMISFVIIILTYGRTALFATAFTLLLVEFVYAKGSASRMVFYLIGAVAVVLIIVLLLAPGLQENGNPLIDRFSQASQDLKYGRLNLWIKGYQAFIKNIFLGVGPGNLHAALSAEGFPMTSDVIASYEGQHVENYYLTILYTYGAIGFFFCLRIFYFLVSYSYRLFVLLKGRVNSLAYGGAMLGGAVTLLMSNITNPALIFDQRIRMLFIFMVVIVNNSFLQFDRVAFFKKSDFLRNLFTKR